MLAKKKYVTYTSGSLANVTIAGTILILVNRSEVCAMIEPNNVAAAHLTLGL